ncbi:MAG TPA: hybrid sensor histidine kinase/response regulator [Thermoanaerobaculia bacterium]|nr:hybrid sensor histidine kinase/response regulator [Thermoanaerobaculia bacterium]
MESSFDREILAGFAAEVHGYLPRIEGCLVLGENAPGLAAALAEGHRSLHSVKGAAAMLGLAELSAVAAQAEALFEQAAATGHALTDEQRGKVTGWLAEIVRNLPEVPGGGSEPSAPPATSPPTSTGLALVGDLEEIFREEARDHLDLARTSLRSAALPLGPSPSVVAALRRSFHTLKGAASMMGLAPLAGLAHQSEDLLDGLADQGTEAGKETLSLLADSLDQIEDLLRQPQAEASSEERLRVPVAGLDQLVRLVGDLVVERSALERRQQALARQAAELRLTTDRVRGIAERLETDYEVRALQTGGPRWTLPGLGAPGGADSLFDELELDRYTQFHQLTRALAETSHDLSTVGGEIAASSAEIEGSVHRFSRLSGDLQDGLFALRMVPLATLAGRLDRTARATARERGKSVQLILEGEVVGLDKQVLDRIADPLVHLVRNAVDHGIEPADVRVGRGKSETGQITVRARQRGPQVEIEVADDGGGFQLEAIRATAAARGLAAAEALERMSERELVSLIFAPGFSTARSVDEVSGRGVGLDVVRSTVQALRGSVSTDFQFGLGSRFVLRLPTQLAIARVLLVAVGVEPLAIPVTSVERVFRLDPDQLGELEGQPALRLDDGWVRVLELAALAGYSTGGSDGPARPPALLLTTSIGPLVVTVDGLGDAQEVLVKGFGSLVATLDGFLGTTILGDGSLVLIADVDRLAEAWEPGGGTQPARSRRERPLSVLVVDDSLSVRKVLANLLTGQGWQAWAARDGIEALEVLGSLASPPDAVLLDVEMPRLDGYGLLSTLRAQQPYRTLPVVMLTSRAATKHRERAFELGASDYLIKPYHPEVLLDTLERLVDRSRRARPIPAS